MPRGRQPASGIAVRRRFGVSVSSLSQLPAVTALGRALNRSADLLDFYVGWGTGFPTQQVASVTAAGSEPEITWEPWDYRLGVAQSTWPLKAIGAGTFDTYVRAFARAAAATHVPLMLRFAHEMNSSWYPWAVGVNGNTAQDYIAAYRHVHSIFAASGATNVSFVWSPNVIWRAGTDPAPMYPGADAVDVVGIDGYNAGTAVSGSSWQEPASLFGQTLSRLAVFAPGKPVLIAETASSEHGGDKAAWISHLVAYSLTQPQILGFVWSEYGGRVADWPIESSPRSVAAMRAALAAF